MLCLLSVFTIQRYQWCVFGKKSRSQIPFWERATCLDCKNWAARCLWREIRRICKKNHFRGKNQRIFHGISLLAISDYVASTWPLSKTQEVCDICQGLLWISSYPLLGLKMMVCNQHFFKWLVHAKTLMDHKKWPCALGSNVSIFSGSQRPPLRALRGHGGILVCFKVKP